ncbi:hypothetical protein EOM09_08565, partial [bacterium]|nr:hypothetical protein [bacterium]
MVTNNRNNQKNKSDDKDLNDVLSVSRKEYKDLLEQMSKLTEKHGKEFKSLKEAEQKFLLDMTRKNNDKIREEKIKDLNEELLRAETIHKEKMKQLQEEFNLFVLNMRKKQEEVNKLDDDNIKRFNEIHRLKGEQEKNIINNASQIKINNINDEIKALEKEYKEQNDLIILKNKGLADDKKNIDAKKLQNAVAEGELIDKHNSEIARIKKEKEETLKLRKIESDKFNSYYTQQKLVNDLYYESLKKQREGIFSIYNITRGIINQSEGILSVFGESSKLLGWSGRLLLDVMAKPSKKKIEKEVEKKYGSLGGGITKGTIAPNIPENETPDENTNIEQPLNIIPTKNEKLVFEHKEINKTETINT